MTIQSEQIQIAIHDIHQFFTDWIGGRCPGDAKTFQTNALDRISDDLVAIFPAGRRFGKQEFEGYMSSMYGSNPDFRIQIRDIQVTHLTDTMAVVNYEEWQRNAKDSHQCNNGRVTTMVVGEKASGMGVEILQVHETWLPNEIVAEGDFSF